jgi:hypothetical protein
VNYITTSGETTIESHSQKPAKKPKRREGARPNAVEHWPRLAKSPRDS